MSFFANVGYQFSLPGGVTTDGSVVLASAMPMHQIERRKIDSRYPHMKRRLFDPQLYLSNRDPQSAAKQCANLASYPWFGVEELPSYDSGEQNLSEWKSQAVANVHRVWPGAAPEEEDSISQGVKDCVQLQRRLGMEAIILPSPLTVDPGSDYGLELRWLDAGLDAVGDDRSLPVYATVALSDLSVGFLDPPGNKLLDAVSDSVSARGIDGVYLVLEQTSEPAEGRLCSNRRSLWSMLHLTHLWAREADLTVVVNFLGPFGLAAHAAGASIWVSGWYKSVIRLRLMDSVGTGRAYPQYWSHPAAVEINMDQDFDSLVAAGLLPSLADETDASKGLLAAARAGKSSSSVPEWTYRQSNVSSAKEHYYESLIQAQAATRGTAADKLDMVESWLEGSQTVATRVGQALGIGAKTRAGHPFAWREAFRSYRQDQAV